MEQAAQATQKVNARDLRASNAKKDWPHKINLFLFVAIFITLLWIGYGVVKQHYTRTAAVSTVNQTETITASENSNSIQLDQQRLEKQRFEQDQLDLERIIQQRLKRQRLEPQRLEQQRLEQQRLEQQRLEQQQQRLEQQQQQLEQQQFEKENYNLLLDLKENPEAFVDKTLTVDAVVGMEKIVWKKPYEMIFPSFYFLDLMAGIGENSIASFGDIPLLDMSDGKIYFVFVGEDKDLARSLMAEVNWKDRVRITFTLRKISIMRDTSDPDRLYAGSCYLAYINKIEIR